MKRLNSTRHLFRTARCLLTLIPVLGFAATNAWADVGWVCDMDCSIGTQEVRVCAGSKAAATPKCKKLLPSCQHLKTSRSQQQDANCKVLPINKQSLIRQPSKTLDSGFTLQPSTSGSKSASSFD